MALGVIGQIHIDGTGLIVVDNRSDSAILHSGFRLLVEGGRTAGAEGYFPFQRPIQRSKILLCAKPIDENVVILPRNGGQGLIGIAGGLRVAKHPLTNLKIRASKPCIVHRGYGQGIGVRPG